MRVAEFDDAGWFVVNDGVMGGRSDGRGVLDRGVLDRVYAVSEQDAVAAARRVAKLDGILAGISSGAALAAVIQLASEREAQGKRVVVVLCDTGERYITTGLFD